MLATPSRKLLRRLALGLIAAAALLSAGVTAACERVQALTQADLVLAGSAHPSGFDGAVSVTLPDALGQRVATATGVAWYRIAVPRSAPGIPCALLVNQVSSSAVVFLNGRWLGTKGKSGRNTWNHPLYLSFASDLLSDEPSWLDIGLRTDGVLADGIGAALVGPDSVLRPRFERALLLRVGVPAGSSIVTGLLCVLFAVLARSSRDAAYGWFSLTSGFCTVVSLNYFWTDPPLEQTLVRMLASLSGMWLCCSTGMLVLRLLAMRVRAVERAIALWALLVLCAAWLAHDYAWAARVTVALAAASLLIPMAGLVAVAADRKVLAQMDRRVLLATGAVALLLGVYNISIESLKTAGWLQLDKIVLFPYLGLVLSLGFGSVLFGRLLRSHRRAMWTNRELRLEVAGKHAELEQQFVQMRDLERRQVIAVERERMVREMHDGVGGSLVALLALADRGTLRVSELSAGLREALDDMRLVIHSLDPGAESIPAVLAGMRARIEPRLRSHGLRFRWAVQDIPDLPGLGPPEILQVLRIVQEAIANALKHAGAQSITIATGCSSGGPLRAFVAVMDDGKGMPPDAPRGRGLENMRKRARALAGELELHSGPSGTIVKLWIPVRHGS